MKPVSLEALRKIWKTNLWTTKTNCFFEQPFFFSTWKLRWKWWKLCPEKCCRSHIFNASSLSLAVAVALSPFSSSHALALSAFWVSCFCVQNEGISISWQKCSRWPVAKYPVNIMKWGVFALQLGIYIKYLTHRVYSSRVSLVSCCHCLQGIQSWVYL